MRQEVWTFIRQKQFFLWVVALTLSGLLTRLIGVDAMSYWMDEGFSISIAQAILQHGYPLLDSGVVTWRDPFFHYLLAGIMAAFGTTEWATRLLSVLAGAAFIPLMGVIASRWFSSERAGVLAMIAVTFSTWEITWSRQARMYMLFQLLFWLTLYCFERWYGNRHAHDRAQRQHRFLIAALVGIVLTALTHQFGVLLIPIILFRIVLDWLFQTHRAALVSAFGFILIVIGSVVASVVIMQIALDTPTVQYWQHYTRFLKREHIVMLSLAVCGILIGLQTKHRVRVMWLASSVLFVLAFLSYGVLLLHYRYFFVIYPAVVLCAVVAVDWALRHSRWMYVALIPVIALLIWQSEWTLNPFTVQRLESDPPDASLPYKSFTPQPDVRSAYAWIAAHQSTDDVLVTPYPSLTRLYLPEHTDDAALYVDLVGTHPSPLRPNEHYTGIPYLTTETLQALIHTRHGFVLMDDFARRRMDTAIVAEITEKSDIVFDAESGPWSRVWVYRF